MPVMSDPRDLVRPNQHRQNLHRSEPTRRLTHLLASSVSTRSPISTLILSLTQPNTSLSYLHPSTCLVNNAVPLLPLRVALPPALPPLLRALRPLPSNSSSLTRPLLTRRSSNRLPCRLLLNKVLAPASLVRWPRLPRK